MITKKSAMIQADPESILWLKNKTKQKENEINLVWCIYNLIRLLL